MKKILWLLVFFSLYLHASENSLTPSEGTAQINQVLENHQVDGWTNQQHQNMVNIMQRWHNGLSIKTLSPKTASFNQLKTAVEQLIDWQRMVNVLGLDDQFPQADTLIHDNIEKTIPPLARRLYQQCKNEHQVGQLKNMIALTQWVVALGIDNVDIQPIQEMIKKCGQFKLILTSKMSWGGG